MLLLFPNINSPLLFADVHSNSFSLGVVESVLCDDRGQHGESEQQDEKDDQHGEQPHPNQLREKRNTVPTIVELVVSEAKGLQL